MCTKARNVSNFIFGFACWDEKAFQSFLCDYIDIIVLTSVCPCVFSFGCYLLFLPFNVEGTVGKLQTSR